jgi:DNA ligase-4
VGCFFPLGFVIEPLVVSDERRPDRVYGLQEKRLERIIEKALGLGISRVYELQRLQDQQGLDFASAVQQIMSATDETLQPSGPMTIEEIDDMLDGVASTCSFSSSEIRKRVDHVRVDATAELVKIFRRLHSSEAKWKLRLLRKDLRPVEMPEAVTLVCFHFLLPDLLKVRSSLPAALKLLDGHLISQLPACPCRTLRDCSKGRRRRRLRSSLK